MIIWMLNIYVYDNANKVAMYLPSILIPTSHLPEYFCQSIRKLSSLLLLVSSKRTEMLQDIKPKLSFFVVNGNVQSFVLSREEMGSMPCTCMCFGAKCIKPQSYTESRWEDRKLMSKVKLVFYAFQHHSAMKRSLLWKQYTVKCT